MVLALVSSQVCWADDTDTMWWWHVCSSSGSAVREGAWSHFEKQTGAALLCNDPLSRWPTLFWEHKSSFSQNSTNPFKHHQQQCNTGQWGSSSGRNTTIQTIGTYTWLLAETQPFKPSAHIPGANLLSALCFHWKSRLISCECKISPMDLCLEPLIPRWWQYVRKPWNLQYVEP